MTLAEKNSTAAKAWVKKTPATSAVPDFTTTSRRSAGGTDDEIIEDGLAIKEEIARFGGQPASTFTELDEFFKEFDSK